MDYILDQHDRKDGKKEEQVIYNPSKRCYYKTKFPEIEKVMEIRFDLVIHLIIFGSC